MFAGASTDDVAEHVRAVVHDVFATATDLRRALDR
jgi:hypothetical protein